MKQFQFELWQECNNCCKFCFLGRENRFTPDPIKIKNLHCLLKHIRDIRQSGEYENISLIGGEFFQGQLRNPEVQFLFESCYRKIFDFLDEDIEKRSSWISATLTIGNQEALYNLLEEYTHRKSYNSDLNSGLWICTSYDTIGRFHTEEAQNNWKKHMKQLTERFPKLKKNTCMIMTDDLICRYNRGEFTFGSFMEDYRTQIFLKVPDEGSLKDKFEMESVVNGFFPKRENMIEFLTKTYMEEPWIWDRMSNVDMRANVLVKNENNGNHQDCERHKDMINEYGEGAPSAKCGHSTDYSCYIDSDNCFKCDMEELRETLS